MTEENVELEADTDDEIRDAKALGWKAPGDWKGEPPKNGFLSARDYLERGKTILPIVNARLKSTEAERDKIAKEFADFKADTQKTLDRLADMHGQSLKALRRQITEEFEQRKLAAVQTGDTDTYTKLKKDEKEALKDFDEAMGEAKELKQERKAEAKSLPEVDQFFEDNPWMNPKAPEFDVAMHAVAVQYDSFLKREQPNLDIADHLAKVRAYVQKRFPAEFKKADDEEDVSVDDTPKRRGSPVEGGTRVSGANGSKSAWSKLPSEAQKQADAFIEEGLFLQKGENKTEHRQKARERYAVKYLENDR